MNKSKEVIQDIISNYNELEKSIVSQLCFEVRNHYSTQGAYREQIWKSLFRQIIPKKFAIEQGIFIIDSHGNISNEVDLAIFDEQYTPYIFNYGQIRFIPIEAVAVVVQCKSKNFDNKDLVTWVESIDDLKTSTKSIVRIVTEVVDNDIVKAREAKERFKAQTATRPIKILCHFEGKTIAENLFDIILTVDNNNARLKKTINTKDTLQEWYKDLNHYKEEHKSWIAECDNIKDKKLSDLEVSNGQSESTLLSLIFQLNQLLMLINNPMFFPHRAYVDMFKSYLKQ